MGLQADVAALAEVGDSLGVVGKYVSQLTLAGLDPELPPIPPLQTVVQLNAGLKCNISPSLQVTSI